MRQPRDFKKIKFLDALSTSLVERIWTFPKVLTTNRGFVKTCYFCFKVIYPGQYRYTNSGFDICEACALANEVK